MLSNTFEESTQEAILQSRTSFAQGILKLELLADSFGMPTKVGEAQGEGGDTRVFAFRSVKKNSEGGGTGGSADPFEVRSARRAAPATAIAANPVGCCAFPALSLAAHRQPCPHGTGSRRGRRHRAHRGQARAAARQQGERRQGWRGRGALQHTSSPSQSQPTLASPLSHPQLTEPTPHPSHSQVLFSSAPRLPPITPTRV